MARLETVSNKLAAVLVLAVALAAAVTVAVARHAETGCADADVEPAASSRSVADAALGDTAAEPVSIKVAHDAEASGEVWLGDAPAARRVLEALRAAKVGDRVDARATDDTTRVTIDFADGSTSAVAFEGRNLVFDGDACGLEDADGLWAALEAIGRDGS